MTLSTNDFNFMMRNPDVLADAQLEPAPPPTIATAATAPIAATTPATTAAPTPAPTPATAPEAAPEAAPATTRRVQRVRHELRRRPVRVLHVQPLGADFVSVTFADESLADFTSDGFDDHVKFMFENASGEHVRRDYTPRRFDRQAGTLTIEFALHGHGQASEWARQAAPGQQALIGGPRGSMVVPVDYDWHLLAGDATALPAIHRRLEELPASTRAIVIAQVAHAGDQRALTSAAQLQVQWVTSSDDLVQALRSMQLPAGEGFCWCAGEAANMAQVRDVLLVEKQHPRQAMRAAAYWKRGASDFHENLETPA